MSRERKKGGSGRRRGQKRGAEGEDKEKEKERRDLPPPEELEAMVKGPEDESFEAWKQAAGEADQEEAEPDIMEEDVPPPAKKRKGEGKASRAKRSSAAGPSAPPPSPEKVEKDGLQLLGEAVDRKMDEELSGTMATAKFILGALHEHAASAAMASETGSQGDVTNLELVHVARQPSSSCKGNFSGARESMML